MTTISAQTILRSRHSERPDKILSTLLLRYPRFIHAEFMTHRAFSKNAASSRAIPIKKLIQDVMENPAIPLHWGKNQPGMQAREELTGVELNAAKAAWYDALHDALKRAKQLEGIGAHKQIVNRLLEPFAHITVLVSATEWGNFLELRDHEDAEPHIRILAQKIRKELEREDNIQILEPGEWHLPFISEDDESSIIDYVKRNERPYFTYHESQFHDALLKLSVARCASTSYKTVDGFDMTLEKAIALHDKLLSSRPIHASPAEHVAQADNWVPYYEADRAEYNSLISWKNSLQHRNFIGFRQYRAMIGS